MSGESDEKWSREATEHSPDRRDVDRANVAGLASRRRRQGLRGVMLETFLRATSAWPEIGLERCLLAQQPEGG